MKTGSYSDLHLIRECNHRSVSYYASLFTVYQQNIINIDHYLPILDCICG